MRCVRCVVEDALPAFWMVGNIAALTLLGVIVAEQAPAPAGVAGPNTPLTQPDRLGEQAEREGVGDPGRRSLGRP